MSSYPNIDTSIRHISDITTQDINPNLRPEEYEPIAFFIAHHFPNQDGINNILQYFIHHDITEIVIAHELSADAHQETGGHHYHFWIYATTQKYQTFIKWFKDNYNKQLRGKATKDRSRQYGKVTDIRDELKMLAYTIKDGHFASTISQTMLELAMEMSYEKEENIQEALAKRLIENERSFLYIPSVPINNSFVGTPEIDFRQLTRFIITEYRQREQRCSQVTIKKVIMRFLWESTLDEASAKLESVLVPKF